MKEAGAVPGKTSICGGPDAMMAGRNVPLRGIADSTKRESDVMKGAARFE